ncbi:MAG TPA: GNAT family N-acetyltransferase [Candidatus Binatia bacterium]|nr:GNAT family N-acetyltransferase [Candidatus Binatia bacterium]
MTVVVRAAESPADRLAVWKIREAVFVGEQRIAESIERDGLDGVAWHLVAWDAGCAVGTARILPLDEQHRPVPPGKADAARIAKIGRMAVLAPKRRLGIGRQLLDAALDLARRRGLTRAELSAQEYVVSFYEQAGFRPEGGPYVEAGIPHRRMSRQL